jgi:hypothetical protein
MQGYGTRTKASLRKERVDQGHMTRYLEADKGMTKRVTVGGATFSSATGRLSAANGTFPVTGRFALGDDVVVTNVVLNNGYFNVIGLDGVNGAYLVLDPPPKDEGPITVMVRTP